VIRFPTDIVLDIFSTKSLSSGSQTMHNCPAALAAAVYDQVRHRTTYSVLFCCAFGQGMALVLIPLLLPTRKKSVGTTICGAARAPGSLDIARFLDRTLRGIVFVNLAL